MRVPGLSSECQLAALLVSGLRPQPRPLVQPQTAQPDPLTGDACTLYVSLSSNPPPLSADLPLPGAALGPGSHQSGLLTQQDHR